MSSPSPSDSSSSLNEKFSVFNPSLNKMQYVRLGRSGLQISRVCLGTMSYGSSTWMPWILSDTEGIEFIRAAMKLGINFFDTADAYSMGITEEMLGKAIQRFMIREEVVIATKVGFALGKVGQKTPPNSFGLSRKRIFEACEASLKRLGVDYIDLYQIHRFDKNTPIEETMTALHDLVRMGKVRYIGASSMFGWQFHKMQNVADRLGITKFVSMQNQYNLAYREEEREMIALCRDMGVGIIPYSPLAGGLLGGGRKSDPPSAEAKDVSLRSKTDRMTKSMYSSPADFAIAGRVEEVSKKRGEGVTPAMIALAWLMTKVDAPIVGATKMKHLEEAVAAVEIKLTEEEIKSLEELYTPRRVII